MSGPRWSQDQIDFYQWSAKQLDTDKARQQILQYINGQEAEKVRQRKAEEAAKAEAQKILDVARAFWAGFAANESAIHDWCSNHHMGTMTMLEFLTAGYQAVMAEATRPDEDEWPPL